MNGADKKISDGLSLNIVNKILSLQLMLVLAPKISYQVPALTSAPL